MDPRTGAARTGLDSNASAPSWMAATGFGLRGLGVSRLLVIVIAVAGRAPCLLHLVFDHRDDHVIGYAALPRTVVVQNVTEPRPALLHQFPRIESFQRWDK